MTKRLRRKPVTRTVRPHHEAPKEPRPETHDEAVASRNEIAQSLAKFIAKFGVLGALAVSVSAIFTVMLTLWGFAASWDSKASKSSLDDIAKIVVRLRSDVDAIKKDRETERQENRQELRGAAGPGLTSRP